MNMKRKRFEITSRAELRRLFWASFPGIDRRMVKGDYSAFTRQAFVEWIDGLQKDGIISEALAFRANLA